MFQDSRPLYPQEKSSSSTIQRLGLGSRRPGLSCKHIQQAAGTHNQGRGRQHSGQANAKTEPPPGTGCQARSSTVPRTSRCPARTAAGPHCNIQRWWVRVHANLYFSILFSFFFPVQRSTLVATRAHNIKSLWGTSLIATTFAILYMLSESAVLYFYVGFYLELFYLEYVLLPLLIVHLYCLYIMLPVI